VDERADSKHIVEDFVPLHLFYSFLGYVDRLRCLWPSVSIIHVLSVESLVTGEASSMSLPPHSPYQWECVPSIHGGQIFQPLHTASPVRSENSGKFGYSSPPPIVEQQSGICPPGPKSRIGGCGTGMYLNTCQIFQDAIRIFLPEEVLCTTCRQIEMFSFKDIQTSLLSTFRYRDPTYPLYAYKQKERKRQETQIVKYI
jgi:hypothetical protein